MGRMAVVRHEGKISCIPIWAFRNKDIYEVICMVNKPWNPYYVSIVKRHFEKTV